MYREAVLQVYCHSLGLLCSFIFLCTFVILMCRLRDIECIQETLSMNEGNSHVFRETRINHYLHSQPGRKRAVSVL